MNPGEMFGELEPIRFQLSKLVEESTSMRDMLIFQHLLDSVVRIQVRCESDARRHTDARHDDVTKSMRALLERGQDPEVRP